MIRLEARLSQQHGDVDNSNDKHAWKNRSDNWQYL